MHLNEHAYLVQVYSLRAWKCEQWKYFLEVILILYLDSCSYMSAFDSNFKVFWKEMKVLRRLKEVSVRMFVRDE